jgi:hypothetical protein
MMDSMIPEGRPNVRQAVWEDIGPAFVSWFGDLLRAAMLWIGICILHLLQLLVLRFGWSPFFIHWLDVAEECAVFATIITFFLSSTVSFFWTTFRRTVGGLK